MSKRNALTHATSSGTGALHRVLLATCSFALLLSSPTATALNELPATWSHNAVIPGTHPDGFSTCEEAGESGIRDARTFNGVDIIVISNSCQVDSNFDIRWDYRRVNDFPTTPNRTLFIVPHCQRGYFRT